MESAAEPRFTVFAGLSCGYFALARIADPKLTLLKVFNEVEGGVTGWKPGAGRTARRQRPSLAGINVKCNNWNE
jgi:hypothetical protein